MRPDDVIMFLIMVGILVSISRSIKNYGGIRRCISVFIDKAQNGGIILLFLLALPVGMLAMYYGAFAIPGFRENSGLREIIFRPSFGTMGVILLVFFLNGRLVMAIRGFANWSVRLWNRFGIFQT